MDPGTENLESLITKLAIGLLQQEETSRENKPVTVLNPYIRRGWEALCTACFRMGVTPPLSLPELVHWLHTPVKDWPGVGHTLSTDDVSGALLENGSPTGLVYRLDAGLANTYNPRMEMEDRVFRQIMAMCQQRYDRMAYMQIREFLNRNPLLMDWPGTMTHNFGWSPDLQVLFRQCYEPVPRSCVQRMDGQAVVFCCPHCGWPLSWKRNEAFCHEDGPCESIYGDLSEEASVIPYEEGAMARTTEGIQRYVVAPEIILIRLYDALYDKWGLGCELYPELDAFDLLVTLPGGQRWAVDVKDWKRPDVLALKVGTFPYRPEWDRAFYVFPDYRAQEAGYINAFKNYWTRQKDVIPVTYSQFIQVINRELGL